MRIACGTDSGKYDINFIYSSLLKDEPTVLPWHFPCEWTYLEWKLLRKELSPSCEVDYERAAQNMNKVRKSAKFKGKDWWRFGGSYTSDELRLATRHIFWRLPNLNVRASAAWFGVEDRQFAASYQLCQSLSRLVQSLSAPLGQFKPESRNEVPYDRLSVERHIDVMLRNLLEGELKDRYNLSPSDLEFFGVLGSGCGLGPAVLEPWGII